MSRASLIALLALGASVLGACKSEYGGGGTAVGNPARTFIRPPLPVASGSVADARFQVLTCDGISVSGKAVDADLVSGEGPELPGGDLCAIQLQHGEITGDLQAPAGIASLYTPPVFVDRGSLVLELGEPDALVEDDAAGLYVELVPDGILDPIERSRGAVAYGAGRQQFQPFVAKATMQVGYGGARMQRTSADYPDYPAELDEVVGNLNDVAFGDGVWVAVGGDGYSGVSAVSTDGGFTWTRHEHASDLSGVAYSNGLFAAGSLQGTIEVFDGSGWAPAAAPMIGYKGIEGSEAGFLALAGTHVAYSADGVTWDQAALPGVAGFGAQAAAYGDGTWIAVGDAGYRVRSQDGLTWDTPTSGGGMLTAIAFDGASFYAVGVAEGWTTDTGLTWSPAVSKDLRDVTTVAGQLVALDESGAMYADQNAQSWEPLLPPPDTNVWTRFASTVR